MSISIRCECGQGFRVKDRLAGKSLKCPKCGTLLRVPEPEVFEDVLEVVEEVEETLGDPLDDLLADTLADPLGAGAESALWDAAPGALTAKPLRAPRKPKNGSRGWSVIRDNGLQVVVAITALILFLGYTFNGHYVLGPIVGLLGGAVLLVGLTSSSARRSRNEAVDVDSNSAIERAGSVIGILLVSSQIVLRVMWPAGQAHEGWEALIAGLMFLAFLGLSVAYLVVWGLPRLARRFGSFGVFAGGYLMLAALLPMASMAGLLDADGVIGRQFARNRSSVSNVSHPLGTSGLHGSAVSFPERGPSQTLESGIEFRQIHLTVPEGQPGRSSTLFLYLPSGRYSPASLPCVFIAPAGAVALTGIRLQSGDRPEHIPYVRAGFAVVAYEVDGPFVQTQTRVLNRHRQEEQYVRAHERFAAAEGGLVNARNAIEYVLARVPEVDPNRLAAAGHSSAGTTALLLAAHEPRIKACIAYAPVSDVEDWLQAQGGGIETLISDSQRVTRRYSPWTHASRMQCPVFLFHAGGDQIVSIQQSVDMAARLRQNGTAVTLKRTTGGDHYGPMITEGIPAAVAWLERQIGPGLRPRIAANNRSSAGQGAARSGDSGGQASRSLSVTRPRPKPPKRISPPEVVTWSVKPDPPAEESILPQEFSAVIPLPGSNSCLFPSPPSLYAMISEGQQHHVVDLRTGEVSNKVALNLYSQRHTSSSDDGRYFAAIKNNQVPAAINVWSFESGEKVSELDVSDPGGKGRAGKATPFIFCGGNQLLVAREKGDAHSLEVWDIDAARVQLTMPVGGKVTCLAVSPGKRYVVATQKARLTVFDLASGKRAGESRFADVSRHTQWDCSSLKFSPDGSKLAGLYKNSSLRWRLFCWDVSSGVVMFDRQFDHRLVRALDQDSDLGRPLQWVPGSGDLVFFGRLLLDHETGRPLYEFAKRIVRPLMLGPHRLLAEERNKQTNSYALRVVHLPADQLAYARKVVRRGGQLVDLRQPLLTQADRESTQTRIPEDAFVPWSAEADPGPDSRELAIDPIVAGQYSPMSAKLGTPGSGKLFLYRHVFATDGHNRIKAKFNRLDRFDLVEKGKRDAEIPLPEGPHVLFDSGPKGDLVLVGLRPKGQSGSQSTRLDIWSADSKGHIVGWRPNAYDLVKSNQQISFASFIDRDHVLTRDGQDTLVLWKIPECRAVYAIGDVHSVLAVSPGRKYVVVRHNQYCQSPENAFRIYEAHTGKCRGTFRQPLPFGFNLAAIRSDGKRMAIAHGTSLASWDLTTGERDLKMPIPPVGVNGGRVRIEWIGDRYLLGESRYLIDLDKRMLVWQYLPRSNTLAAGVRDEHLWLAERNWVRGVPLELKHVEQETAHLTLHDQAVAAPGDRISISTRLGRPVPWDVERILEQKLEDNGYVVVPDSKIRLTLTAQERASGGMASVHRVYLPESRGRRYDGPKEISGREILCGLEVHDTARNKRWVRKPWIVFQLSVKVVPGDNVARNYQQELWSKLEGSLNDLKLPLWFLPRFEDGLLKANIEAMNLGETDFNSPDVVSPVNIPKSSIPSNSPARQAKVAEEFAVTSKRYVRDFHLDLITSNDADQLDRLRWHPGAKRPTLGVRWGLALQLVGKTKQPKIERPRDLEKYTGPIGAALVGELNQRTSSGAFGQWPQSGNPRFREVALASGRTSELLKTARTMGLDALVLIDLTAKGGGLAGRADTTLRVSVIDVRRKVPRWNSTTLSSNRIATGTADDQDPRAKLVADVLVHIDENFRLTEMPTITPATARRRAVSLTTDMKQDPLHILAEIRYYHAKGLLTDQDAVRYYDEVLGPGQGQALLEGTSAERRQLLSAWLEKRDAAREASNR